MKLLATGVSGTIGKHLGSNISPLVLDLLETSLNPEIYIPDRSHLIHLAGIVGPSAVSSNISKAYEINVLGTLKLGEAFKSQSRGKFTFVSTSHVYSQSGEPISEINPVSPANVYAEQKMEVEKGLADIFADSPERLCVVRVFSVLDWDVAPFTLGGGIRKLSLPNSDYILSNSDDIRDFLTPNLIARSLSKIAVAENASGVLNLCSGHGLSVGDAARKMLTGSGFVVPENRIQLGLSSNPVIIGNNDKLMSLIPDLNLIWAPSRLA